MRPAFARVFPYLLCLIVLYFLVQDAENEIKLLRKQIKSSEGIVLKDQLKCMKRVLRRLGLTNKGIDASFFPPWRRPHASRKRPLALTSPFA